MSLLCICLYYIVRPYIDDCVIMNVLHRILSPVIIFYYEDSTMFYLENTVMIYRWVSASKT